MTIKSVMTSEMEKALCKTTAFAQVASSIVGLAQYDEKWVLQRKRRANKKLSVQQIITMMRPRVIRWKMIAACFVKMRR